MTELLPCPFCGGTEFKLYSNWVQCKNDGCQCEGPYGPDCDVAWNSRRPAAGVETESVIAIRRCIAIAEKHYPSISTNMPDGTDVAIDAAIGKVVDEMKALLMDALGIGPEDLKGGEHD